MKHVTPIILIIILSCLTFMRNETWRDNASLWQDVLQKSPYKIRAYNNFGNSLDFSAVEIAIRVYEQALRISPKHPVLHYNLGRALVAKGSFGLAIAHFTEATRYFSAALDPRYAYYSEKNRKYLERTLVDLGAALFVGGSTSAAADTLLRALAMNPDNALAHYNLGVAYAKMGRHDLSLYHLNRAHEIEPNEFPEKYTEPVIPEQSDNGPPLIQLGDHY